MKWYEEVTVGVLFLLLAVALLLNGFTYMLSLVIERDMGPTKQTGIITLMSMIETSWWKYLIVVLFSILAFFAFKNAKTKYLKR